MDEEERWIEDEDEVPDVAKGDEEEEEEEEEPNFGGDLFNIDKQDPNDEYTIKVGDSIELKMYGIKAKYPQFLQSTGLTLWKGSEALCDFLGTNAATVRGKLVVELGAGLGLCGITAHKLGAQKVILTDGDTDTLGNMRKNVASNNTQNDDSMVCKQLLWGRKVAEFREAFAPDHGFDVVMGGDVAYAQESLDPLFDTALSLLSMDSGSVFLVSCVYRNGVTIDAMLECAEKKGFQYVPPEEKEGVYVFSRAQ